jgi:hypothetical protein
VSVSSGYSSSCATSPAAPHTASCASTLARSLRAAAARHARPVASPGRGQEAGAGHGARWQPAPAPPRAPTRKGSPRRACPGLAEAAQAPGALHLGLARSSTACRGTGGQAGPMLAQREAARALQGPACVSTAQTLERLRRLPASRQGACLRRASRSRPAAHGTARLAAAGCARRARATDVSSAALASAAARACCSRAGRSRDAACSARRSSRPSIACN